MVESMDGTVPGSVLLYVSYLIMSVVISVTLSYMCSMMHSIRSFKALFLSLCLVWTLLRGLLGLLRKSWPQPILYLVFWVPVNVQFSTFSLLIVYVANMVHRKTWERKWRVRFLTAYVVVNAVLLALLGAWIAFESTADTGESRSNAIHSFFSAAVFILLVIILGVYGFQLLRIDRQSPHLRSHSRTQLVVVIFAICVIFAVRCAVDLASSAASWLNVGFTVGDRYTLANNWLSVALYLTWELVPTALLIYVFRSPSTRIAKDAMSVNSEGDTGTGQWSQALLAQGAGFYTGVGLHADAQQTVPKVMLPGNSAVFENDRRYDSDDETGNPGKGGITEEHRHLNNSYSLAQGSLGLPPYMFFFGGKGRSKDGREDMSKLMAKVSTANVRRLSSSSDHMNTNNL